MITRYKFSLVFIAQFALVLMPFVLNGQTANIPYHNEPYIVDSGVYNGEALGSDITKVFSRVIQIDGSSWLRLLFSDANLGENSYIEITSLSDNARQRLDAHTMVQWFYASAYFNGEAVKLELFAAKTDNNVFVRMQEVMVGEYITGPIVRSQCGPTDDRVSSSDPAVGRIVPIGCTGWLIPNGLVVTAGHCLDGSGANVLEFNVPPSLPGGTIQHPPPEDQYSVIPSSKIFTNGGIGNDWGVFEVFENSITGLHPMVAQGAFFTLAQDLTPPDIRITGFGVDDGVDNQTQQTHVGPNVGSTGTTMRYQTDTQGGNSGSPVIDDATHFAVGVHTHGGCNTNGTGNNNGTSTFHPQFWAALNVPGNFLPDSPENFSAYSDYTMPTSMLLTWKDPGYVANGDTLLPSQFHIHLLRDGVFVDSIPGGQQTYLDSGLTDGVLYQYEIFAKIDSNGFSSPGITASWIAGGSPIPNPPTTLNIHNAGNEVMFFWNNPANNIDGTPMDDFSEIRLYQDSVQVATFTRSSADTGRLDSALYTLSDPGAFHSYYITAADNENPQNESGTSNAVVTPLAAPIADAFTSIGEPDVGFWRNENSDVNEQAQDPPSGTFSLNFNGKPNGGDVLELHPTDITGMENSGIKFAYFYQPQGQGNAPEDGDSLMIYFRNDTEEWVKVMAYPGTPVQPFQQEVIDIATAPSGSGSYFHSQFQVRIRSIGSASATTPNDDWFVDNVYLGTEVAAIGVSADSIAFDTTLVGNTSVMELELYNIGLDTLQVSDIQSSDPQFGVDITSFSIGVGGSQMLQVSFTPSQGGVQTATLSISSNDPAQGVLTVAISGIGDEVTSVSESVALPQTFAVAQNYPNPFNPTTTIKYQLPQRSAVRLVIYNMLGQQVRLLLSKTQGAGFYKVEWDGRNDAGQPVGSGIYFYRFTAGEDFVQTNKMILMK